MLAAALPGLFALLVLVCFGPALAEVTRPELECLHQMYDQMGGPGWWKADNWPAEGEWGADLNPCDPAAPWYGISCGLRGSIIGITLSGNNLVGKVPQCVWAFKLSDFELSTTHLEGPMPMLDGAYLQTLYYKYNDISTLPANICEMELLDSLHTEYNDMAGFPFPECFHERLSSYSVVDCVDCHMVFNSTAVPPVWKDLGASNVYLGGNPLNLALDLSALPKAPSTTVLDISETGTTGRISLSDLLAKFPKAKEVSLQDNALTGTVFGLAQSSPTVLTLDLAGNEFAQVLEPGDVTAFCQALPSLIAFRASRNRLGGFSPALDELDAVYGENPALSGFDLSENPFFCRRDGANAFGCTYLRVLEALVEEGEDEGAEGEGRSLSVSLTIESNAELKAVPVELMGGRFSAAVRIFAADGSKTTESLVVPGLTLERATAESGNLYTVAFSVREADISESGIPAQSELLPQDFAILFDDVSVSTGDLRVLTEDSAVPPRSARELADVRASLQASAAEAVARSSPAARPGAPGSSHILARPPQARAAGEEQERLLVEFYGISKCPGYIGAVEDLASPLILKYPELMASVDIRFVTEGHPAARYITGGMILHGQAEVMGDKVLMCAQEYLSAVDFNRLTSCLYFDGTSNRIPTGLGACVEEVAPGPLASRIMQCASSDYAIRLLAQASETRRARGAAWSCTIYTDSKLTCVYGDGFCPFRDADVDGFHRYLCGEYEAKFGRPAPGCS